MREYLNRKESMEYIGISKNTLTKWILQGLPIHEVGRKKLLKITEIDQFIKSHKTNKDLL